jgi:hypothetical protein
MANRLKITFPSNPSNFYLMNFTFYNTALGYSNTISKVFVSGTPTGISQVKIGATLSATMDNLLANLLANEVDANVSFELGSTGVFYINPSIATDYSYTNLTAPSSTITTFDFEAVTVPEPETLPALNYKDISIRIYDTYTNTRVLAEELAQADVCKIDWDGGDDLYKEICTSKLVFNMRVADAADAHFIHLFSGDEQRYRVEVVGVAVDLSEQLIWQGFLLPDQYQEPYTNDNLFVDFTATDVLKSMKGKYLEPWYYQNTFPIAQVFAYCLEATGLQQNIIVNPSVVPDNDLYNWQHITVDLRANINGEKYDDCYTIIEKLCTSNILTLLSYRGYWWLNGMHRKGEVDFTSYQFDSSGTRIADLINSKNLVDLGYKLQPTPSFTAITPWKKVNVNFKAEGGNNYFSDNIVNVEDSKAFFSIYKSSGLTLEFFATIPMQYQSLGVIKNKSWIQNINSDFEVVDFNAGKNLMWMTNPFTVNASEYNYSEAMALSNYLKCPEAPYLQPGILYELELDIDLIGVNVYNSDFIHNLKNGYYDKLVPFQIFIDGEEKFSNRPSFNPESDLRYKVQETNRDTGIAYDINFTLKFNFKVDTEGYVEFRFLMPILQSDLGGAEAISEPAQIKIKKLSLNGVEGYDENKDTIGVRDINYSQELDYDLDYSCTIDNSVINSFGINFPTSQNYFKVIDRTNDVVDVTTNHAFNPATLLNLNYHTWSISASLLKYLFENNKSKTLFLERVSGVKELFNSIWYTVWRVGGTMGPRMGYLTSYTGFPVIPKNYKAYSDIVSGDTLKYMHVEYAPENFTNRLNWKLYGSNVISNYPKAIARALHGVQPEMVYRLEASALRLLFPDDLIEFYFADQDRVFIPTKLSLNLFAGKTSFIATESKFVELSDISYE